MSNRLDLKNLFSVINENSPKIFVIGDIILDEYICGGVDRISPEAPVPVVKVNSSVFVAGGASNVALNINALGGQSCLCGFVNLEDESGKELSKIFKRQNLCTRLITDKKFQTTKKTRITSNNHHICRVDSEDFFIHDEASILDIKSALRNLKNLDLLEAIVIQDYGKGFITQEILDILLAFAKENSLLTVIDPHISNPLKYNGINTLKCNLKEALFLAKTPSQEVSVLAKAIAEKYYFKQIIITLGGNGVFIYRLEDENFCTYLPTLKKDVVDVSGAGDTFLSAFITSTCSGVDFQSSCLFANQAAGIAVSKFGTSVVSQQEMLDL